MKNYSIVSSVPAPADLPVMHKSPAAVVTRCQKRISDPLLEHIDIQIEVPRADYEKLSGNSLGETSETIRARV